MKHEESKKNMDYLEPSMEIVWFNVTEDMVRTSDLEIGDGFEDEDTMDDYLKD